MQGREKKIQQQYTYDVTGLKVVHWSIKFSDLHVTYSTLPVKLIPAKWGDFVMLSPNVCPDDGIKFTTPEWKKKRKKRKKTATKTKDWQNKLSSATVSKTKLKQRP